MASESCLRRRASQPSNNEKKAALSNRLFIVGATGFVAQRSAGKECSRRSPATFGDAEEESLSEKEETLNENRATQN